MQYNGPRMLEFAAPSHKGTSFLTLPSWAVDWSLSDLVVTPEHVTDNPGPERFGITRSACNKHLLRTSVQVFGKAENTRVEILTFEASPPGEDRLDIAARLIRYLPDVSTYSKTPFPASNCGQNLPERLTYAMVLYSTPDDFDTESATHLPSEIKEALSLLQEQMFAMSNLERRPVENTKDVAAIVLANSWLGMGAMTFSDTPASDEVDLGTERTSSHLYWSIYGRQ